tara:strand:+ start:708 stop:995 length:288 start_codon:yes stop_codon:yes gene_type:complete
MIYNKKNTYKMSFEDKYIETILSIVMYEDGRKFYMNSNMINDITEFKKKLNEKLIYYGLSVRANDIIVYHQFEEEKEIESSSDDYESEENFGYGR